MNQFTDLPINLKFCNSIFVPKNGHNTTIDFCAGKLKFFGFARLSSQELQYHQGHFLSSFSLFRRSFCRANFFAESSMKCRMCSGPSNFCVWGSAQNLIDVALSSTHGRMDRVETALMTIFAEPISDITQSLLSFKQVQYSHIFHAKTHFCGQLKKNLRLFVCKCILHFFFFLLTAAQSLLCAKKFYFAARQIKLSQFRKLTKDILKFHPSKKRNQVLKFAENYQQDVTENQNSEKNRQVEVRSALHIV